MLKTEVLRVDPHQPAAEALGHAAEILRRGGLVAFPTETVYGLGANARDPQAVARIFEAKGRPATNPLIVHVGNVAGARSLASQWPVAAERLAVRFWPGPLTIVVKRGYGIPEAVTARGPTVGVRCPSHRVAQGLLEVSGLPLAAPSANRSSRISPTTAEHVLASLEGRIELVLDGGPTPGGIESTVVDVTVEPPRVLRPGPLTAAELRGVLGKVESLPTSVASDAQPLRSPGLLGRHYAPRARVVLTDDDGSELARDYRATGKRVGRLVLSRGASGAASVPPAAPAPNEMTIVMDAAPERYARRLYAELHRLDAWHAHVIVVQRPPDSEDWTAIRDRLERAASD